MMSAANRLGWTLLAAAALVSPASAKPARFDWFRYQGEPQERATAGPGEYRNPILPGYYPDPSITRVGEDYYLVNSSFTHFPGLPVFHSRDLVSWRQIGNALDRAGQFDFKGLGLSRGIFAPDISFHDGLFYIAGTCVDCGGNFVITARDPAGPWSDPVWLGFEGIDPSIFWDGEAAWIVNNGAPAEVPRYDGHRAIWLQRFDWRARRMVGSRTVLVNGGTDIAKKPSWIEGPHLLKRDSFYYLIAAEGGTGDQHSEVVFRSRDLAGPFEPFAGNPILSQRGLDPARTHPVTSAGHAKFVETQSGEWWATFLATRPYAGDLYTIGRETFLLPVTWRDGWPQVLPHGAGIPFVAKRPKLPAAPVRAPQPDGAIRYVEEFDGAKLGPEWIGVRVPRAPVYRLEGGALVLDGGAKLGDTGGVPAFVGRRLQQHVATVSTQVRFAPAQEGDRAGLAAVQSDRSHLFFGVTRIGGLRQVALYTRDKADADTLIASAPVADGPVTLTLRMNGGTMAFDYAAGGDTRTLRADVDASLLTTARAGGFVGTVIGPYAWTGGDE
jgi:xylan 1,4-beta-xylosidase